MVVYKAGRQLGKVRFIILLSLFSAIVSFWLGIELIQTYGTRPADGGVLAPLGIRIAWGGGVMLLGIAFAAGMWLYSRRYIARLDYDKETGRYTAYHVWFLSTSKTDFYLDQVLGSSFNHGRTDADSAVNAPWWWVRIKGKSSPLILDAQGDVVEEELLKPLIRRSSTKRGT